MATEMRLANKVTIDRNRKVVLIDGEVFPYFLAEAGPEVDSPLNAGALPMVTLPVLAKDLEIIPATEEMQS